jgi:ribonuclease HII
MISWGMPDFDRETALGGRVAGVDEVGRGPLAGPVIAASVILSSQAVRRLAPLLNDSKQLTREHREQAFAALMRERVEYGVSGVSVAGIGRMNILQASLLAMRKAVARLPSPPDHALIDGNQDPRLVCPVTCVVGGDAASLSIAAASIIAKVLRDRLMQRLSLRFPAYGWDRNAGYATRQHREALRLHGATVHHRASFGTVRQLALFD